jgi:hypothetical protein
MLSAKWRLGAVSCYAIYATVSGCRPAPAPSGVSDYATTVSATATSTATNTSTATAPATTGGSCISPDYGLSQDPAPASRTSYPATDIGTSALPALSLTAKPSELKAFVATVYDLYPVLKQIYEDDLGLTRQQTLAFMYADMSRESAGNNASTGVLEWNIGLETAVTPADNPAHAWGPFQAAVTNFTGGGYDSQILSQTGLPTPDIKDFRNPAVSTYAGIKRLAEGVLAAIKEFGPGKPASLYLLGTLAHHNTGWCNAAQIEDWRKSYGNEVLRLMNGYFVGENMGNDRVFYTGQAEAEVCR